MSSNDRNTPAADATDRNSVAGYFANSEDAHRAINELVEEGFSGNEIGAAFHGGTTFSGSDRRRSGAAETTESTTPRPVGRADSTGGGAASGTERVFPWGFATGGGTVFAGAPTNPGPIPGSEIPSTLPRDIPSELPSQFDSPATSASQTAPATTASSEAGKHAGKREPSSEKEALNYGTGEGHLPLASNYNYAYSGPAFESSFSGMGIPQEHSRRLSRDLQRGGAIVTVKAGSRNSTAEAVMERNNGVIRYDTSSTAEEAARNDRDPDSRVDVYGEVHRVYPGYIQERDVSSRKAS